MTEDQEMALIDSGEDKKEVTMPENDLPPCLIFIDKEGKWYHKGAEMIHREFIRLFYEQMRIDHLGRYVIEWQGTRCYVDVEDTPFVVRSVRFMDGGEESKSGVVLYLSDDSQEDLIPDTVYVGKDDVLYCKVKQKTFPARFSRPAYYQFAEYIEEEDGDFVLILAGKKYPIHAAVQ